jgi:hypothetical protein
MLKLGAQTKKPEQKKSSGKLNPEMKTGDQR